MRRLSFINLAPLLPQTKISRAASWPAGLLAAIRLVGQDGFSVLVLRDALHCTVQYGSYWPLVGITFK